jgi:hypothetical protein
MVSADEAAAVAYLRTPLAIRARCETILEVGLADELEHFTIALDAMPAVIDKVVEVMLAADPELRIPFHGRIDQLRTGGVDRVAIFDARLAKLPADERARIWADLITVSVLLDAGAGDTWRYREHATGVVVGRSEGLAVASLHAFTAGLFSSDPAYPLRVDATALRTLDPHALAEAFQATVANPIIGIDGRIGLVRELGTAMAAAPTQFVGGRPGGLVDHLRTTGDTVSAPDLLAVLLEGLASIWPVHLELGGASLGDVWRHGAAGGTGPSAGLVPFHQLTQWLAYSLFEPLERAGITISQPGALTALAEYRNGGLLVDLGVLVPKHERVRGLVHGPGDDVIVEWRALTVALLDRVALGVCEKLAKSPAELPLAALDTGSRAAGRAIAAELRTGGGSPIRINSDGTVF